MAKPLTWDEIFPGDILYEECLSEMYIRECRVLSRDIFENLLSVMVMGPTGKASCVHVIAKENPGFRYWDSYPTRVERDRTPWRALYES